MIPKVIHYFWFGQSPKPSIERKCIESWKKFCPDYEIIEWNEDNFSLEDAPLYIRQAYENKKWAFISDYGKIKILYEQGGIYFDTDIELLTSIDHLLKYKSVISFLAENLLTNAFYLSEPNMPLNKELMDA